MRKNKILVTEFDSRRLKTLLITAKTPRGSMEGLLNQLQCLLDRAEIVVPESIPAHVVTMNSKLRLKDNKSNKEMVVSLVFPADARKGNDFNDMNVSILSPIGLSIFGLKTGDIIFGEIRIEEILFQPEATGCFYL